MYFPLFDDIIFNIKISFLWIEDAKLTNINACVRNLLKKIAGSTKMGENWDCLETSGASILLFCKYCHGEDTW